MSWLDDLFLKYRTVQDDGSSVPARGTTDFIGFTIEDDAANDRTKITNSSSTTSAAFLQGYAISTSAPTDGQVLTWVDADSEWAPEDPSTVSFTGTGVPHVIAGVIQAAASTIVTADMSDDQVTYAKIQNVAGVSLLGRSSSTTGDVAAISAMTDGLVMKSASGSIAFAALAAADLSAGLVTYAKIQSVGALSVLGRSSSTSGDIVEIAAASNNLVLRRSSNAVSFSAIEAADISSGLITYAKIQDGAACSVVGRSANSSGANADITGGTNDRVLKRKSNLLSFAQVETADIADDNITTAKILNANVTLAKIENGSALSVIGRAANSSGVNASLAASADGQALMRNASTLVWTNPAQWLDVYELDFTVQGTQSLATNTNYTIDGKTWTKINSANDATAMALTNGTGLVCIPGSTSDYNAATRTVPMLGTLLSGLISDYDPLHMAVRLWVYTSSVNYTNNYDSLVMAIDDASAVLGMVTKVGFVVGGVGLTRFTQINSVNAAFNNALATAANTNNVSVMEVPRGIYGGIVQTAVGTYSSGFPAESALKWHTPYAVVAPASQPTNGNTAPASITPMIQVGGQRAGSGTSLNVTIARIKVQKRWIYT